MDNAAVESAPAMVSSIVKAFGPGRIVDVGCGTGALASEFMKNGVKVSGLEYADAGIKICKERGVDVRKFDIETSGAAPSDLIGADLVVSFEVAEHLPESISDKYVSLMTSMADRVVISAAPPGQGGVDHVNEQPKSYWVEKFQKFGFDIDETQTEILGRAFKGSGSIAGFYLNNTFVFSKR